MVFNENKSSGDLIKSDDWDEFVDFSEAISGVAYDIYHSGSFYSLDYSWYTESAQKLSEKLLDISNSGTKYTSSYDWYLESSSKLSTISGSLSSKIGIINNGYANVSHGGTIAHGINGIPTYVNVIPSSMAVNFGISCKVDDTNITVYLTALGDRDVFWMASLL